MRKILLWFLVITSTLLLTKIGLAFQNETDGFRGLKWGDPPTPAMEFGTDQNKWMSLYRNPNDKLELGDAQFYMIIYQFYMPSNATVRRLLGVGLYFKDKENFELLEIICKAKFGEPTKKGFYEFNWASLSSMVTLSYDSIDEDGHLGLGSMPIFKQYTQEKEKQQAEEAEKDW